MDSIEKVSRLCLVACDQSYWGGALSNTPDMHNGSISLGTLLAPYSDSNGSAADSYPNTMPANFYDPVFTGLSEWAVFDRIDDPSTGFGATIYQRLNADGNADFMVAFQGTRGPNAQDWGGNLGFAVDKWQSAEGGQQLMALLRALLTGRDGDVISGDIYFTGQSLGGALAEYAAYEFRIAATQAAQQELIDDFSNNRIALITFNGLGGIAGLQKMARTREEIIDLAALAGSETRHYWIPGDIVHRLGEGTEELQGQVHLNGQGDAYRLDFFASLPDGQPDMLDGQPRWNNLVDAHRVETGFYAGLNYAEAGFLFSTNPEDIRPLHLTELASSAIAFGNLYNSYDSAKDGEAMARIVATLIYGIAFGDKDETRELIEALGESGYRSGVINKKQYEIIQKNLPSILNDFASSSAGVKLQMRALILGGLLDSFEQTDTVSQGTADTITDGSNLYNDLNRYPSNPTLDTIRTLTLSYLDEAVGQREERVRAAYEIARKIVGDSVSDPALYWEVRQITQEHLDELIPLLFKENGLKAFLAKLGYFAVTPTLDVAVAVGQAGGYLQWLLKDTLKIFDISTSTRGDLAAEAIGFLSETAKGLANAVPDLSSKYTNAEISFDEFQSSTQQRSTVDAFVLSLQSLAETAIAILSGSGEALGEEAARTLTEIETSVTSAAQTVVIRAGRSTNPFDDRGFDPDSSPVATGTLAEGSIADFTLYLPFNAGEGGQQIKLRLVGQGVDKLSVLLDEEEVALEADGTFALIVPQGGREASFALEAFSDIDADSSLTLSATLVTMVDGQVVETHLGHEEATISLAAAIEAPPATGREIRGDWAPKPYDDGAGVYYKLDDLGNIERSPGVANTTGFSEPDHKLDGSAGSDHIVTGDYEDTVYGFDGDDAITGSELLPAAINGGAGNDWIEAYGYANHAADYFEFDVLGRLVKLGDDKLYGGAGNDYIYGESEAATAALYDDGVAPTGLPGDWISGGSGDDALFGSAGDDVLMGGIGEDRIAGGAGKDVLLGDDHYYLRPDGNFWTVVHPNYGTANSGFADFEFGLYPVVNVSTPGSELVFQVTGDPYFTYYKDGGGADILIGGAGDDILIGQAGDDTLYGGEDDDILAGWEGADSLYGGSGDDLMAGDFGRYEQTDQRTIDGFAGDYRLVRPGVLGSASSYGTPIDPVGDDFLDGGAGNDVLFGEGGNDVLLGGAGNDVIWGDATYLPAELHGDDLLDGGAGDDVLWGNGGNDKLYGGNGNDSLAGGAGNDLLEGGSGDDSLSGGDGDDLLRGGAGADVLAGDPGIDQLYGGAGDDRLSGGDDDDVLFGEAGADYLDGGAGNDALYGGSGEDVIDGGEGDDVIDGGAGIDIVRGGEGNDTYVVGLGYGRDLIEDSQGENRIRFGWGILPEDLSARLDSSTLAASVSFSAAGDTLAFDAGQFDVAGVEFSNGATWGKAEFVYFMPAVVSQGSSIGEVLIGNAKLRNYLEGGGGHDRLVGARYADVLAGGDGNDALEGNAGSDSYVFRASEEGADAVSDSGLAALAYLDWYYGARGIDDWAERGEHGGRYRAEGANTGDGESGTFVEYFETYEAAYEQYPFATIAYVEPLPEIAPVVTRNDTEALAELAAAGVLDLDVVEFGPGIALEDLDLRIELDGFAAGRHPEQPWYSGGALSVRWGAGGFDVDVPDVRYGFAGTDIFADGVPQDGEQLDGPWRGYRLGEGIEAFRFADGSTYALEEILRRATPVLRYGYEFVRGSGFQTIGQQYLSVDFAADIAPSDLYVAFGSSDLVFGVIGDSALGVISRWYANPFATPQVEFRFADGTVYDPDAVTRLGRTWTGSSFGDYLVGDYFFASALIGLEGDDFLVGSLGNDLLNGGSGHDFLYGEGGDDIYVFGADSEIDAVNEQVLSGGQNGFDTVRFAADVATADLSAERNYDSLTLRVSGSGAEVLLPGWFTEPGGTVERFEFADGTTWDAADVEMLLPPAAATAGDDLLLGFTGDDVLEGLEGNDAIYGYAGNDRLRGGPGNDFLGGFAGDDAYEFELGDGVDEISDRSGSNTLKFGSGIDPQSVYVTRDEDALYLGVAASADRVGILSWFFAAQPQLAQVSFADGTTWSAAELESRIGLVPASEFDDILWGTDGADVLDGLAGDDRIHGNGGDDVLAGGAGADYVESGAGNDILRGGAGDDDLEGWPGDGHQLLEGGDGDDYIYYEGRAIVIGGPGDDWIDVYGGNGIVAFNPGDGADTIGVNQFFTLSIGGGVGAADLSLSEDGADIVISVRGADSVRLTNEAESGAGNWPVMLLQLFGSAHVFYLGGVINEFYNVRASDPSLTEFGLGEVLPRYLLQSSETGALGGVIAHQYATRGTVAHVTDAQLLSVLQDPRFGPFFQDTAFEGGNSAPLLWGPLADLVSDEDAPFSHTITADAFSDPDAGDVLTYTATLGDGANLPAWLAFDAGTRTFSGTPLQRDVGTIDVKVTATDDGGLSAEDTFALTVANVNDAPVVAIPLADLSFEAGTPFSFEVPVGSFTDEDPGDTLSFNGAGYDEPLPAWLTFDAGTGTFAGNPSAGDIGISHLQVTAADAAGATSASDFGLVIRAPAGAELVGGAGDDLLYGGTGDETLTAKGGSDYLYGDVGDDLLKGGGGNDVLQGGDGADVLRGGKGQNVLDGGAGDDLIFGGKGSSLVAGGAGNDTIRTGSGSDVILFNRGDGMDTVIADRSGDNTLSFGGGIRYGDLSLSRDGNNLVVSAGGDDRIVLKNWYAGKHSVLNLQVILDATDEFDATSPDPLYNRKVQTFDFLGMVNAFDAEQQQSPGVTSWAITNALLQFHLTGMDDMAVGGDLAYWYGKKNGFAGISLQAAQQAIGAPGFGSDAQTLRPFSGLQEGYVKLA